MKVVLCRDNGKDNKSILGNMRSAVALGNFDGVHIGHAELIKHITERKDMYSCVYTFRRHPQSVLSENSAVKILTDNSQKEGILRSLDVDYLCFDEFSDVRYMSPTDFIDSVLIDKLNCGFAVCGYNYRFGKNGAGDSEFLKRYLNEKGIECTIVPPVTYGNLPVSSTKIRFLIENGDTETALNLLGRPYYLKLPVIHGMEIGRTIGIPTINQKIPPYSVCPKKGVYVCLTKIDGKEYPSVCNVGTKPTVNGKDLLAETHIIDYSGFLYGKTVEVAFYKHLRDEKKFSDINELKRAIENDVESAKKYFL